MLRQLKKRLLPLMDTVAELLELLPTLSEPSVYLKDGVQALTQIASVLEEEGEPGRQALGQARDLARALTQDELDLQALLQDVRTLQREIRRLPTQLKVVFMPYKIQMWGTLASIYEAAARDPDCIAHVVPVPYRPLHNGPNGLEAGELIDEGPQFWGKAPVIPYAEYDLEREMPDVIFLHNIYDHYNTLTQVEPAYHTAQLRQYTDMLVYVPYFVSPFFIPQPGDPEFWFGLPSLKNVDKVVLAGDFLTEPAVRFGLPREKLLPLGSPKLDSVVRALGSPPPCPREWTERLENRTVFFLNTLYHVGGVLKVVERVLNLPEQFPNAAVIWRPHPLTETFIRQNYPQYEPHYQALIQQIRGGQGVARHVVLDESPDYLQAMSRADVMLSGSSSLLNTFLLTQKPIIFLDGEMPKHSMIPPDAFHYYPEEEEDWKALIQQLLQGESPSASRKAAARVYANTDGTCGEKVYQTISQQLGQDIHAPIPSVPN